MNYKKLTGIGVLCAVMLLAGASSVFATNESVDSGKAGAESLQEAGDEAEKAAAGGAESAADAAGKAADTAGEAQEAADTAGEAQEAADTAGEAKKAASIADGAGNTAGTAGRTDQADGGQLVKYTITKIEDGKEYVEHSGKADAEILGPDVIRLTLSEELFTEDGQEKAGAYYAAEDGSVYRLEEDNIDGVYRLEKNESISDEQKKMAQPEEIMDADAEDQAGYIEVNGQKYEWNHVEGPVDADAGEKQAVNGQ